jgi:DNA gyrase/topoisomerase IV subunit A
MSETNEITSLNIDEVSHEVSDLSEEAQQLVGIYNNWMKREVAIRERLNEVQGELTIIQAAQQTLSAQIVNKVREEVAAKAAEEAAAETAAANVTEPPPAAEPTPEDPKAAAE